MAGAIRLLRDVKGATVGKYLSQAVLMINGIQPQLPRSLRLRHPVVLPASVSRTVKGFVNCDAPLDKLKRLEVGWEEYCLFLTFLNMKC